MEVLFIVCFALYVVMYFFISVKEGNFFNIFLIPLSLEIPILFIFEPIYFYHNQGSYNVTTYTYIYLTSVVQFLALVIGFYMASGNRNILLKKVTYYTPSPLLIFSLFILSYLIFLPVFLDFGLEVFFNPRSVYSQTRYGYGLSYFLSNFVLICSFSLFLLSKNKLSLMVLFYLFSAYIKGQKGVYFSLFSLYLLWLVYQTGFKLSLKNFSIFIAFICSLIYFLYLSDNFKILDRYSKYSDYNRNFSLVMESDIDHYHGQLNFENFLVSKIPRYFWNDKPVEFGSFILSNTFKESQHKKGGGSPSFKKVVDYADFGLFGIVFTVLKYFIIGVMLKFFINLYIVRRSIIGLMGSVYLLGADLLGAGVGFFLFEIVVAAWFLSLLIKRSRNLKEIVKL